MHLIHTFSAPKRCVWLTVILWFSAPSITFLVFQNHVFFFNYVFKTRSLFTRKFISKDLNFHMSIFSSFLLLFHWFVLLFCYFQRCNPAALQWRRQLQCGAEKGHLFPIFALLVRKDYFSETEAESFLIAWFFTLRILTCHILFNNINKKHGNLKYVKTTDNFTLIKK